MLSSVAEVTFRLTTWIATAALRQLCRNIEQNDLIARSIEAADRNEIIDILSRLDSLAEKALAFGGMRV
jgi:predicted transcriptional regulator